MAIFEKKYRVDVAYVNADTVITNHGLLTLLEDIAGRHSDVAGFGICDIQETKLFWILLAWKVKFFKRVKYRDELTVKTWARNVSKAYTYRDFEVFDKDGNIVCKASSKWVLIEVDKGSITKIPDYVISKYEPDSKHTFDTPDIEKLKTPTTFSSEYIYKVQRRDIDINNHMHNTNYLDLAYEALPEDVYNSGEFNNIEIMYKTSIRQGESVKCLYSFTDNCHYVTVKSLDDTKLHAVVKLY